MAVEALGDASSPLGGFENYTWQSGAELLADAKLVEIRPGRTVRLLTRESANPGGPTVVFVHGSCASLSQYLPVIIALVQQRGIGVVAYDWLGCGGSQKPDDWAAYNVEELHADLAAVWDLCVAGKVSGRRYLVGHSFGTHLALRQALRLQKAADPLDGLALLAGTLWMPDGGHPLFRLPVWVLRLLQSTMTRAFLAAAFASGTDQDLLNQEEAKCNENPMSMCKAYYRQLRSVPDVEIREVQVATIVLHGTGDGLIPAEQGRLLSEALPGLSKFIVIDGASHNFMLEKPGAAAQHMAKFIDA